MLVKCTTQFDITHTGVLNNFSKSRIPFYDNTNKHIIDAKTWQYARNQQRNWETLNQIISLRILPTQISKPTFDSDLWSFTFDVEHPTDIELNGDPVGILNADATDVPMITGLGESKTLDLVLKPGINIFFSVQNQ